jgi:hypothetical protein
LEEVTVRAGHFIYTLNTELFLLFSFSWHQIRPESNPRS